MFDERIPIQVVEMAIEAAHDAQQDSRPPSVESTSNKMHRLKPEVDGGLHRSNSNRAWSPLPMRRSHSPQPFHRYSNSLELKKIYTVCI